MPSSRRRPQRPVYLVSLGCPKNSVDGEQLLADLRRYGYRPVDRPEQAELLIVNTCAFIQDAERESVQAVMEAAAIKRRGRVRRLWVSGCLVARHGETALRRLIPEIDAGILLHLGSPTWRSRLDGSSSHGVYSAFRRPPKDTPGTAYVKIAEGCSRRCTFCLIPSLRGPFRSRPPEDVVAETETLVRHGAKEIVLVAQDTSRYGTDQRGHLRLAGLVDRLLRIRRLQWLRLMYVNPEGVTEPLIRRLASEPRLCSYLDMPVQHADPEILRAMGRSGSGEALLRLIARLRRRVPDLALRTTLLTGFPGETETAHRTLLDFVQRAGFDRLGVFAYSPETGTPAARLPGQVHPATKARRRRELMRAQAPVSGERLCLRIGRVVDCLVEEPSGRGHVLARTRWDAPEVDGGIVLRGRARPGQMVRARILGATDHDLTGDIV